MSPDHTKPYVISKDLVKCFQNHIGFGIIRARGKVLLQVKHGIFCEAVLSAKLLPLLLVASFLELREVCVQ